ncbi:MAG TPA: hypothetical protein V6D23_08775 [Candidatus Obscuribacterales bacterium]
MKSTLKQILSRSLVALTLATGTLATQLPAQAESKTLKQFDNSAEMLKTQRTTRNGRYSQLLAKVNCAPDRLDYGHFHTFGLYLAEDDKYCGEKVPAKGYWVYVYPDWYIWGQEDLSAVGMGLVKQKIRLVKTTVDLELAYLEKDKAWGEDSLAMAAKAIQDLEKYSGKPYPGDNPYRIEEDPELHMSQRIGLASSHSMRLATPNYSSPWTVLHETVHIWNAPIHADWVCEGMADTVSWLLMTENHFAFDADETMDYYLREWKPVMGTGADAPLTTDYDNLPQGKAMVFWLMLYQLYGPEFLRQVFVASLDKLTFGPKDLARMLAKVTDKDPQILFSGWLEQGPYQVRQASDFGPVKYQLPKETK